MPTLALDRQHVGYGRSVPGATPTSPRSGRADAILEVVATIPAGRVMTYGDVARVLGIPSARIVGQVLSRSGGTVPWHRVVLSTGQVADHLADRQLTLLTKEGVALRGRRVDLRLARWSPSGPGGAATVRSGLRS